MENLGVDLKLLIAQLINFGLFFFLYKKFIANPFLTIISEEKKKDEERRTLTESIETQKKKLKDEEKSMKDEARLKMEHALSEAEKAAEATKQTILLKAREEADSIAKKAKQQLQNEQRQMQSEYKNTVAKMSLMTLESALKSYLDEDMQKEVNKRILTKLSSQN